MSPEDLKAFLETLPIKKKTTTAGMLMLIAAICFILGWGVYLGYLGKTYFDDSHKEIMAAIAKVDADNSGKISTVSSTVDANSRAIEGIRTYYFKTSDMTLWANQLDHLNRLSVPALVVPDVQQPKSASTP